MTREAHIQQISHDISNNTAELVTAVAQIIYDRGYRKVPRGTWIKDNTYTGREKVKYSCSCCGHWQTVKQSLTKIYYTRHCPYCGAEMCVTEESKPCES